MADIQIERLDRFEALGEAAWTALWRRSCAPTVFGRYEWALTWWQTLARGRALRLYVAWADGIPTGLLPLAVPPPDADASQPVVLVGDEHADYAGVLATGERRTDVLDMLIDTATGEMPAGRRLLLRDVRDDDPLASCLARRTRAWQSGWVLTGSTPCPRASLGSGRATTLANKRSLKRHARALARLGTVDTRHHTSFAAIAPRLEHFFDQHVARWSGTPWPSLFLNPDNRALYRALARSLAETGDLLFTEVCVDGLAVAFHFGFISDGDLIWYKPSFDPALAACSPGESLLRELLIHADQLGLQGLDFSRGDEAFKRRFADQTRQTLCFQRFPNTAQAMRKRIRMALGKYRARLKLWTNA